MGKAAKKKKTAAATVDFETLEEARNKGREQYGLSENTKKTYKGYVRRARKWLVEHVQARRDAIAKGHKQPNWRELDLDKLEKAFDDVPNKYTPYALEMLLTQKCLHEDKSLSTGQGMYSAMKNRWENM
ncbi:hypothetical protein PsYK624_056070 [Phanerochaete sordida]|uniref:Uncharacterized protein n=1 Tax=Phanerochaete sordida TaxID=48140 RepID=A0A9P3G778_9APHY|nr:hypothetical protein PsYK624_056070 [Phanerochaete sordida]